MEEDRKSSVGGAEQQQHVDSAMIRAVKQKKPAPEIDFTLHTMDDGTQVSTTDRVCKGTHAHLLLQEEHV
jgi:serine/threonine-protein phosphatase 2B catalytic subunit